MSTLEQLYAQATHRADQNQLPYAGAILPAEAFELLQLDPAVRLVDVRTRAEIEWIHYPGSVPNTAFIQQLREVAAPDTPVLFLCRSAARSKLAAVLAQKEGFTKAFDLLEGFEGDKDGQGHRKTTSGWCFRGLPWIGA
jgi:rhodanese-related sulfurtransferase